MSNEIILGAGVRVEIGYTEGAPKTISGVDLANPSIAHSAAHGLTVGSAGYFDQVTGMDPLDGQAARVASAGSPSVDNFGLEDIDTTTYPDFTSGVFVPVTTWSTLSQSTQYSLGGGAGKTEDVGTLIDTTEKLLTIKNAAETVQIDIRSLKVDNQALAKIRTVARQLGFMVFRITLPGLPGAAFGGGQRLFRGQPSLPGESVQQGATGTGQLSVTIRGRILYLGAAA